MWGSNKRRNRFVRDKAVTKSTKKSALSKLKIIIWLAIIIVASLIFLLFFSQVFTVKQIVMPETKYIAQLDLEKTIWDYIGENRLYFLPQNRLLLLDKQGLADRLYEKFQLNNLKIKKQWPSTLVVELSEKDYALVWHENNAYYYINREGDIILETLDKPKDLIIVDNLADFKKTDRKIIVDPKYLDGINNLNKHIFATISDIKIAQYVIDGEANTFKLKVESGPMLYFNTEEDIVKQVNKLIVLRQNTLIGGNFNNQMYIDLRYGDKVFYQ